MTQYASHIVLTKPLPCLRGNEIYLKICLPNESHTREDTNCFSKYADQIPPMRARNIMHPNMCWPKPSYARKDTIYLNMCTPKISRARKETKCSQQVLTKPHPCQRGHKIYFNSFRPNPNNASEEIICISKCIDQPLSCQRGHKIYFNLCWPNSSLAKENTKCISASVDQTHPILARTKKWISTCVD